MSEEPRRGNGPLFNGRPWRRIRLAGEGWLWTAIAIPFVALTIIALIAIVG